MKTSFMKIMIVGIAAGLCLSAHATPAKKGNDVVSAKCSKKAKCSKPAPAQSKNSKKVQAEDPRPHPSKFYWPKKSAARQVLDGQ